MLVLRINLCSRCKGGAWKTSGYCQYPMSQEQWALVHAEMAAAWVNLFRTCPAQRASAMRGEYFQETIDDKTGMQLMLMGEGDEYLWATKSPWVWTPDSFTNGGANHG